MIMRLFGSWMQRHVNDPYVKRAVKEGYRARSAYKLLEIHEKTGILKDMKMDDELIYIPNNNKQNYNY